MALWTSCLLSMQQGWKRKSLVVFETLFQGETEIAGHEDIEDEGQTVTFVEEPKIGTTATVDGQHTAEPTGEIAIVDVVEYTGLTARYEIPAGQTVEVTADQATTVEFYNALPGQNYWPQDRSGAGSLEGVTFGLSSRMLLSSP